MRGRAIQLLNEYGDGKFGDEWWPANARAWLAGESACLLERLLTDPGAETERAACLINEYGEAKFGHKWRPDDAGSVLGDGKAEELQGFLSDIEMKRPHFS